MGLRVDLHAKLVEILGSSLVYFQPASNTTMEYPCIIYHRSRIRSNYADNQTYRISYEYTITCIFTDPDSLIPTQIASLPQCVHDRRYVSSGKYHDVFKIIF